MTTPMQQPGASPAPRSPGQNAARKAVVMLGAGAAITALALVSAPWWVVAVVAALGIVMPGVILLAQVVLPEDSEHKRDLLMAALRYLDRRAMRKVRQGEAAALKKGQSRGRRRGQ
ncbi:hypothetical protein [Streptomyces sp. NBC_00105]|uniref:hypothetical protein n=1 Tax=Streptomyces sp. NBC_00105 TaxID=2903622 RepID=UPI00324E8978